MTSTKASRFGKSPLATGTSTPAAQERRQGVLASHYAIATTIVVKQIDSGLSDSYVTELNVRSVPIWNCPHRIPPGLRKFPLRQTCTGPGRMALSPTSVHNLH